MARSVTGARRGFTLVETLLVIVVGSLMMGIAIPKYLEMREGMRLDAAAYQLAGDMRRAQIEAVKRNQTIVVAKTGTSTYSITTIGNRAFEPDITFDTPAMTVSMRSFGPPAAAATFTILHAGRTKQVIVGANGLVRVQ